MLEKSRQVVQRLLEHHTTVTTMSRFGSAVVLGDLDDFLAPTQACVNPLFVEGQQSTSVASADATPDVAQVTLHSGIFSGIGNESVAPAPTKPDLIKGGEGDVAHVSLTDCLACSGCVTSAETVLITEQSVERLVAVLQAQRAARVAAAAAEAADAEELQRAARRAIVVSISPQAQAAFATHLGVSAAVALRRLVAYFKTLGAARVYDTSHCVELSVVEACVEFAQRFTRRRARRWAAPSSSRRHVSDNSSAPPRDGAEAATPKRARADDDVDAMWHSTLPMLSSSCPGWVCFAEKRHPEILPCVRALRALHRIVRPPANGIAPKLNSRPLHYRHRTTRARTRSLLGISGRRNPPKQLRGRWSRKLRRASLGSQRARSFTSH